MGVYLWVCMWLCMYVCIISMCLWMGDGVDVCMCRWLSYACA